MGILPSPRVILEQIKNQIKSAPKDWVESIKSIPQSLIDQTRGAASLITSTAPHAVPSIVGAGLGSIAGQYKHNEATGEEGGYGEALLKSLPIGLLHGAQFSTGSKLLNFAGLIDKKPSHMIPLTGVATTLPGIMAYSLTRRPWEDPENTEKTSEIKIIDKTEEFSPISDTLGFIGKVQNRALGVDDTMESWDTAKKKGVIDEIKAVVKDFNKKHPKLKTKIYLGGNPWLSDSIKDYASRPKDLSSTLGLIYSLQNDAGTAFARSDAYNTLRDTITLYTPSAAVLSHELGHALDRHKLYRDSGLAFNLSSLPGAILSNKILGSAAAGLEPVRLLKELSASGNADAVSAPKTEADKKRRHATLGAGLGSYLGLALGGLLGFGLGKKFNPSGTMWASAGGATLGNIIGPTIGRFIGEHTDLMDRLPTTYGVSKEACARITKKASKLVDAALKISTMTKEIPGNMDAAFNQDGFSILNEDLDPETLEAIEHLLESGILKK